MQMMKLALLEAYVIVKQTTVMLILIQMNPKPLLQQQRPQLRRLPKQQPVG